MKKIVIHVLWPLFMLFASCSKDQEKPSSLTEKISHKWDWIDYYQQKFIDSSPQPIVHYPPPQEAFILFEQNGNLTIFDGQNLYHNQWVPIDANTFQMTLDTQCKIDFLDEHHLTLHFQTVNANETTVFTWVFEK